MAEKQEQLIFELSEDVSCFLCSNKHSKINTLYEPSKLYTIQRADVDVLGRELEPKEALHRVI